MVLSKDRALFLDKGLLLKKAWACQGPQVTEVQEKLGVAVQQTINPR